MEVAELIIKGVKEGGTHALELFPKILSAISSRKMISYCKGELCECVCVKFTEMERYVVILTLTR